jgi:hypothetical protein
VSFPSIEEAVMSVSVRRFAVALTCVTSTMVLGAPGAEAGTCATAPPPAGIAQQCLTRTFTFNESMGHDARRAVLTMGLSEWMDGCFPGQTGLSASEEAEASAEHIFELVKDLSGSLPTVRVAARYTPEKYTEGGRTCYRVESVVFGVPGAEGSVDADGDIEVTPGPPADLVREAAAAGKKALQHPSIGGGKALSKMLGVLQAMETHGTDIDDTWYDVTPTVVRPVGGDLGLRDFVPIACFTEPVGGRQQCLAQDDAKSNCERHFADQLVTAYHSTKTDPVQYGKILVQYSNDIQHGVDYLHQFVHLEAPTNVVPCESIKDFMDRIGTLAQRHSIYMAGQY